MGDVVTGDVDDAIRLVQSNPTAAVDAADRLLEEFPATSCPRRHAQAMWAKGLALRELSRPAESASAFEAAAFHAELAGDHGMAAQARVSLSLTLAHLGRFADALKLLDAALPVLSGPELAQGLGQRALILLRAGRFDDALPEWDRAVAAFAANGDVLSEAKALVNRGTVLVYLSDHPAAMVDMERAETKFRAAGAPLRAAEAVHDRGFAASRQGDIPAALRLFDQAQREMGALGVATPTVHIDRVETLLMAGLAHEAADIATAAADQLRSAGLHADLAELSLLAARACEDIGDDTSARRWADQAEQLFAEQGRTRWQSLARLAVLRAELATAPAAARAGELGDVVDQLVDFGWLGAAVEACMLQVRIVALLDASAARLIVDRAALLGRRLPAASRAQVWLAEAIVRRVEGRRGSALRALRAGVDLLESHQTSLGAVDLRASSGARIEQFAEVGASISLSADMTRQAFSWFERARTGAVRLPRAVPHPDSEVAAALEQLRSAGARLEHDLVTAPDAVVLRRRITALEELIRRRLRYQPGAPSAAPAALSASAIGELLGPSTLIEYGVVDGVLLAIVADDGGWRSTRLCPLRDASNAVDGLRHALVGYLTERGGSESGARHIAELAERAEQLLIRPLQVERDSQLVIVPVGPLHALAWAALPSMTDRTFTVSPSACIWAAATTRATLPDSPTVFVAVGPGLGHGDREAALVAACYDDATLVTGHKATAEAVLEAASRHDIIHVASHGSFRADNPLFSSLRLADGPLSGYELSRADRHPALYVLSACDAAVSAAHSAGAIGLAGALLASGAAAVVASVTPADDAQTPELMADFHACLARGRPAAAALAEARSAQRTPLTFAGFSVYGASVHIGSSRFDS